MCTPTSCPQTWQTAVLFLSLSAAAVLLSVSLLRTAVEGAPGEEKLAIIMLDGLRWGVGGGFHL